MSKIEAMHTSWFKTGMNSYRALYFVERGHYYIVKNEISAH